MANINREGLTRRNFIKTIGFGGLMATGLDGAGTLNASEPIENKAPSVPKRKLGKTGVEVSILSLGGMFDTINNRLILRQAYNWGVRYWDTAERYGNGSSEEGYGRFFTKNPDVRKEIFLTTKLTPRKNDALTDGLNKCLERLRTDYVDLFLIHGIGGFDEIGDSVREWALHMKEAGKMKFFGFSTHSNMEDCLTAAAKSGYIDAVLFSYNFRLMNSQRMKDAVAACVDKGVGLIAMKTQGGGPLKAEGESELQMAQRFLDRGFTDKQAKLKAVWENENIASICSQMPNMTILSANVAASRDLTVLAREDLELLDRFAAETRQGYCAGCSRLCYAAVGGAVPVSDVMRCLMYYRDYGDRDLAGNVYAGISAESRSRLTKIDYSEAERVCPQRLAITDLMREASKILG
ncbi:MAG: aldo/keto reductase [Syntrophobacteraceae bacterium]